MGMKYICEVKKDGSMLELVHPTHYNTSGITPTSKEGAIKFNDVDELHRYFKHHCVSEHELKKTGNSLTVFYFVLLALILLAIILPLCKGSKSVESVTSSAFGRFSF
jgi:hypothetical protein